MLSEEMKLNYYACGIFVFGNHWQRTKVAKYWAYMEVCKCVPQLN